MPTLGEWLTKNEVRERLTMAQLTIAQFAMTLFPMSLLTMTPLSMILLTLALFNAVCEPSHVLSTGSAAIVARAASSPVVQYIRQYSNKYGRVSMLAFWSLHRRVQLLFIAVAAIVALPTPLFLCTVYTLLHLGARAKLRAQVEQQQAAGRCRLLAPRRRRPLRCAEALSRPRAYLRMLWWREQCARHSGRGPWAGPAVCRVSDQAFAGAGEPDQGVRVGQVSQPPNTEVVSCVHACVRACMCARARVYALFVRESMRGECVHFRL